MFEKFSLRSFVGFVTLGLVFLPVVVAWSCKVSEQKFNTETESEELKCEFPDPPDFPKGGELNISAERQDANQFLVRIRNVSPRKVYVPYSPTERETVFVSYLTEKRNQQGDFDLQPSESDFAPGLHSLNPDSEIKLDVFEVEKGEYRLIFRYLVDERLANLLNKPECLTRFAQQDRPAQFASGRVVSPILKITRGIGTPIR